MSNAGPTTVREEGTPRLSGRAAISVSAVGAAERGVPNGEKGPGSSAPTLSAYFILQSRIALSCLKGDPALCL